VVVEDAAAEEAVGFAAGQLCETGEQGGIDGLKVEVLCAVVVGFAFGGV